MDPQQRIALEIAIQAIEDAGHSPDTLPHKTGVFLGITAHEYRVLQAMRIGASLMATGHLGIAPDNPTELVLAVENLVPSRPYTAPGTLGNMSAAIIAQELDLHGPAYTTDAACASSHMAIFDAVQQLRTGSIDAALAGGAYICVTPEHHIAFSRIGAMSANGQCLPFDERADGFVQGDGAGIVLLKRLEDAEADGDRIYALIQGMAINNDGRGDGPMAPDKAGQCEAIDTAWEDSGLDKRLLGYMEAHGTGTAVGDKTEFQGLQSAFPELRQQVAIGSSKANVGHTMSAAGAAGIIRAALSIYHKTLPPMAGFETPKPELNIEETSFYVPTTPTPWKQDKRYAGISSFGFGGTNGHIVLSQHEANQPESKSQAELILMSAPDEQALRALAGRTAETLHLCRESTLSGFAKSWSLRTKQSFRLGLVAESKAEVIEQLRAIASGDTPKGCRMGEAGEAPKIAFMFPGQGAQRVGMLRDVTERFPIVAQTLNEMEEALAEELEIPLTHLIYPELRSEKLDPEKANQQLTDTANCQPAMFACGMALFRLLEQLEITPTVVIGHSLGEFTAAAAGGVLSAADSARFVARRGRAMASLSGDHGAMAAIMADRETAAALLVDGAVLANFNHPRQLVVSGSSAAIREVVSNAKAAGVKAVQLNVSHGFHSPALDHLDSEPLLEGLQLRNPSITVASGISNVPYRDEEDARGVFLRHAVSPVDFERGLRQCRDAGADLFLQVGAGGPLTAFARGSLPRDHKGVLGLAGKNDQDGGRSLLETLAQLWTLGVDFNLRAITGEGFAASVPPTVLPREHYWIIKDEPQLHLELDGVQITQRQNTRKESSTPESKPADTTAAQEDTVPAKVLEIIGKVSAYPLAALKPTMSLTDDLGFDSLMVGDLASGLGDAFSNIEGIPQELLINRPTVQDIIDFAANAAAGTTTTVYDDDAPLHLYATGWQNRELPQLPQQGETAGKTVHLYDQSGTFLDTLVASFSSAGATVHTPKAGEKPGQADLVIFCALDSDQISHSMVTLENRSWPDTASDVATLLAPYAQQTTQPDVLALTRVDDLWASGIHGFMRSLGREWPGIQATTLHLAESQFAAAGPLALTQWLSADISADVLHDDEGRQIATYTSQQATNIWSAGPDQHVLITGGTRGIGAAVAGKLLEKGCSVALVGRGAPNEQAQRLLDQHPDRAVLVRADITDRAAFQSATSTLPPITAIVHCAGVLADGAFESVPSETGVLARRVKVDGWLNAVQIAGDSLQVAIGIGSWAGRFGNRHQTHYAAANAMLASLSTHTTTRSCVVEFGPWSESEMVQTIPAPIQATMRTEGIDFVGNEAGLQAIFQALESGVGPMVAGRRVPLTNECTRWKTQVCTDSHAYLLDHAIQGVPVLPLASATDLMAATARVKPPFKIEDVRLFQGVTVKEAVDLTLTFRGKRAEIRMGERNTLAYRATVSQLSASPDAPIRRSGGVTPNTTLAQFYDGLTFHGPALQGITHVGDLAEEHLTGRVATSDISQWIPTTQRTGWSVDPLALDSAMQLSGLATWDRIGRGGTPVSVSEYVQHRPWPTGELFAQVIFGQQEGDKISGSLHLFDEQGEIVAEATDVLAELRELQGDAEPEFVVQPEWVQPGLWKEVVDLEQRLQMAEMAGIRNPYFAVHEGTARDTTTVGERELVNYSSYNYVGLSGDPRVVSEVEEAVRRYGTSVSASRVASGERPFHQELEAEIAAAQGAEDSLVFTAGHATNVTTIGHLFGPEDLILHDEYIHDSALQGIKLSGASRQAFRHDDPNHLEDQLKELRKHYKKVLIIIEGVYSMDGDISDLPSYLALKKKYGCMLMVDEAHSFGVVGATGCGVAEHFGIDGREIDLWMGTLSKSLASCGGWIAASKRLVNYLRYTAPGFVYSAGLTPANGQAALTALRVMLAEPERVQTLQRNAKFFHDQLVARGIDTGPAKGGSGVIPAVTGNSMHALMLSQRMVEAGINVQPIVYPAVADDAARLRFFLSSTHSFEQLEWTAQTCAELLGSIRDEFKL
jgi:8-amino-7-oxononanoate synthase